MAGGGLAVFGAAALIAATVLVLGNHGGSAPAAKHGLAAPVRHTTAPRSASPSPSTTLDSCLIGSWKATSDNLINKINGE
jgi:hypothetical protein